MVLKRLKLLQQLPDDVSYGQMDSPVGDLTVLVSAQGVHAVLWQAEAEHPLCVATLNRIKHNTPHKFVARTLLQLQEYFTLKRQVFDLPLCPVGTAFQQRAWRVLQAIPYGQTISYGEQALRLGDKNKARAVGLANGMNPLSIVVPCHRVIGANGRLTGFGGGLDNKLLLLGLERRLKIN